MKTLTFTKTCIAILIIAICFLPSFSTAQLINWNYGIPVSITETSSTTLTNHQVSIYIDTQTPIAAGQMNTDGSDIRAAEDINGISLLEYWIEKGINTDSTKLWVKLNSLPASSTQTIYLFYGNTSASSQSNISIFNGPHSSTDSITGGTSGGSANCQRGFRFTVNEDVLIAKFGKNDPIGTEARHVTLFDFNSQAIVEQLQVSPGTTNVYNYDNLGQPFWVKTGDEYILSLHSVTSGYYYGNSTQIGQHFSYGDMRFCNSCNENTYPTSVLTGMHYGYPDFLYYTKNTASSDPTSSVGIPFAMSGISLNDEQICLGDSVLLDATVNDTTGTLISPFTYLWSPATGLSCTTCEDPYASPSITTTYTLYVTDSIGAQDSISATVIVASALPVANAGTDTAFCEGETVQLSGSGGDSYAWSPESGLSDSSIANPSASPINTTTYSLIASNGCGSDTDIVVLTVHPLPSINSNDTAICPGDSVQLVASGATSYSWSPSTGLSNDSIANPIASPSATTVYGITGTSTQGCSSTDSITVSVDSVDQIVATALDDTICQGDTTQIMVSACADFSDDFDPGIDMPYWSSIVGGSASANCGSSSGLALYFNGTTRSAATIALNTMAGGSVDFDLKIGSGTSPCENADSGEEIVLEYSTNNGTTWTNINTYPTTSFTVFTAVTEPIPTAAQTVNTQFQWRQLSNSGTTFDHWAIDDVEISCGGADTSIAFTWSPSAGLSDPNISDPFAYPSSTTTYVVTASIGSCTSTDTVTVYVDSITTISAGTDTAICTGDSVSIFATGASVYDWSPATGLSCTTCPNPMASPLNDITYYVTTPSGCAPTDSVYIQVNGTPSLTLTSTKDSICPGDTTQINVNGNCSASGFFDDFETGNFASWNLGVSYSYTVSNTVSANGTYSLRQTGAGGHCDGLFQTLTPDTPSYIGVYLRTEQTTTFNNYFVVGDAGTSSNLGIIFLYAFQGNYRLYSNASVDANTPYNVGQWYHFEFKNINYVTKTFDYYVDGVLIYPNFPFRSTTTVDVSMIHLYNVNDEIGYYDDIRIGNPCNSLDSTVTYSWSPSLGLSDTSIANPVASPNTTTTYTVSVNDSGCITTDSITIYTVPLVSDAGPAIGICEGDSAFLSASSNLQGVTYTWTPDTNLSCSTCPDPIATPSDTITYHVTGAIGTCTSSDSVDVLVNSAPIANAGPDQTYCFGNNVMLTASGGSSYLWSPNVFMSCDTCDKTVVDPPSDMTYYVTVFDTFGCSAIDSAFVEVNGQPIIATSTKPIVCDPGDTVQLYITTAAGMNDDFDPGIDHPMWSVVSTGVIASTDCGSVSGNAMYFNNAGSRFAATKTLNVAAGGTVDFHLKIGSGISPCEDADAGEEVVLEYSTNNGTTWTLINTYSTLSFANFTFISELIPALAQTPTTQFQWRQVSNSGTGMDNWAIDDVVINAAGGTLGSNVTVAWSPAGTLSDSTITNPIASPVNNTSYIVWVNDSGCITTDTVTISIDSTIINASNDVSICAGNTTQLNVTSNTPVASYAWSPFAGLSNPAIANPVANPTTTTSYTVKVTNIYGCQDFDTVVVTVDVSPNALFTSSANGLSVQFNDTSTSASSWSWDFGDGNNSTLEDPQHTYSTDGTYIVCLTVQNSCGSSTFCDSIIVTSCPNTVAQFSYNSTDLTVSFSDLSTNSGTWSWDFGDGQSDTTQNPTHTYDSSGTYVVCLATSNACSSDTFCITINVCAVATADFSFTNFGLTTSFADLSSNATNWSWDFGNGNTSNIQNPSYTYLSNGTYSVCLTASNSCSSDTSCYLVTVNAEDTVGIENIFYGQIQLYPNPTTSSITIGFSKPLTENIEFSIYNMAGEQVWKEMNPSLKNLNNQNSNYGFTIDLEFLNSGTYLVKIISGEKSYVKEIIYNK